MDFLEHIPVWVYFLFCFLIWLGFKASKTSVVKLQKMLITPTVFFLLSLRSLYVHLDIDAFVLSIYVIASAVGIAIGYWQVKSQALRVDRENGLLEIPGTWGVMVLILIIFFTKAYFGYELGMDPDALTNTAFEVAFIAVSAICSGMFVGKAGCYFHRFTNDPSTNLLQS
jgi:hypothetical protein